MTHLAVFFFLAASEIIDDEWQYTRFFPTPKMSSYLFAFTVSEFTRYTSSTEGRVNIKVSVLLWFYFLFFA